MKIGSDNGLASSRHQAITWVSGDPDQWCIYTFLGLIELITYRIGKIYRCGEKRYCLSPRWIPPPSPPPPPPLAKSGQIRPVTSFGSREGLTMICKILNEGSMARVCQHLFTKYSFLSTKRLVFTTNMVSLYRIFEIIYAPFKRFE